MRRGREQGRGAVGVNRDPAGGWELGVGRNSLPRCGGAASAGLAGVVVVLRGLGPWGFQQLGLDVSAAVQQKFAPGSGMP